MARTPAQRKALETKALKADTKSAGMRMLFEAGYTVVEVKTVFGAAYGFVFGVAKRGGFVETAASRRAPRATKAAPATDKTSKAITAKLEANRRTQAREQKAAPAARKGSARASTSANRGRGRPPVTDPKAIASRSPEAQRSAARRAAAGAKTVVAPATPARVSPLRATRPVATVRKVASANGTGSAAARVAAKLAAKGR